MDAAEFRARARELVDYIVDYKETISKRPPLAQVLPGYLKDLIPDEAPVNPEQWKDVFGDIERVIMPGVSHWNSPHFHAYYSTGNSYPAILADMLCAGIGCVGFTWISSPACTELEMITMNWLGKLLKLPEEFLFGGNGGGVIQGSASESTIVALLAAKYRTLRKIKENDNANEEGLSSKLILYYSDQAHSSVEKAGIITGVRGHVVTSDEKGSMRGEALRLAIEEDKKKGLIPFYCVATLGTTSSCAFDKLLEVGPECQREGIWLHIDAAYAGSSFICPEYRYLLDGIELVDSFNFNPHKWLLINVDLSALWLKDSRDLVSALNVDPLYLKHAHQDKMPDYRHWTIPLSRRFRSLKLWFVMRLFGLSGLQEHIRKQISLAKEFEELVTKSSQFEVTNEVVLGLVCFRLKGDNELNRTLGISINADGRIHLVSSESKGVYFLRFCISADSTSSTDIQYAWKVIQEVSQRVLNLSSNNHI